MFWGWPSPAQPTVTAFPQAVCTIKLELCISCNWAQKLVSACSRQSLHRARLPPTPSRCRPPCHQPPPRLASHQPPPSRPDFSHRQGHRPGRPAFSHRPASAHNGPASGSHGTASGLRTRARGDLPTAKSAISHRPGRLAFSYRPGRPASARKAFSSFVGKKHIPGRMACCCWDCPSPAKPSVRPQDRASSGHTAKYDCPCVPLALT